MNANQFLKSLALVSSLITASTSGAGLPSTADVESAEAMAALIQAGQIKVDQSGKLTVNSSVLEMLRSLGAVNELQPSQVEAGVNCSSSVGGGC